MEDDEHHDDDDDEDDDAAGWLLLVVVVGEEKVVVGGGGCGIGGSGGLIFEEFVGPLVGLLDTRLVRLSLQNKITTLTSRITTGF